MLNVRLRSARSVLGIVVTIIAIGSGSSSTSARRALDAPAALSDIKTASNFKTARVLDNYANLPVAFVENRGQADARVRYYTQGPRYAFYLTPDEIVLSL